MSDALVLFAGAGGSSLGLKAAGYQPVGLEYWERAVETHRAQVGPCELVDLSDPAWLTGRPTPPLMWGSPPCQPFSTAGDGAGEDDPRDGLPWWEHAVVTLRPPVAIMENVPGLTYEKHWPHLARHLNRLRCQGFDVGWRVLNCADYGIPQTRRRLFVVARLDGGRIVWPAVTHTKDGGLFTDRWVSMADALGWGSGVVSCGTNSMKHSRDPQDMVPYERPLTKPAPTVDAKAAGAWKLGEPGHRQPPMSWKAGHHDEDTSGARNAYRRMVDTRTLNGVIDPAAQPAPTLTTIGGQWVRKNTHLRAEATWPHERPATTIHSLDVVSAPGWHDPTVSGSQQADAIPVTIAELATLQGFPHGFTFAGTKSDQARQVGNAVPPYIAQLLAEANRPLEAEVAA